MAKRTQKQLIRSILFFLGSIVFLGGAIYVVFFLK